MKINKNVDRLFKEQLTAETRLNEVRDQVSEAVLMAERAAEEELGLPRSIEELHAAEKKFRAAAKKWVKGLSTKAWEGKLPYQVFYITYNGYISQVVGLAAVTSKGFPWSKDKKELEALLVIFRRNVRSFYLADKGGSKAVKVHYLGEDYSDLPIFSLKEEWEERIILFEVNWKILKANKEEMIRLKARLLKECTLHEPGPGLLEIWEDFFPEEDLFTNIPAGTNWNRGSAMRDPEKIVCEVIKLPSGDWTFVLYYKSNSNADHYLLKGVVKDPLSEIDIPHELRNATAEGMREPTPDEVEFIKDLLDPLQVRTELDV